MDNEAGCITFIFVAIAIVVCLFFQCGEIKSVKREGVDQTIVFCGVVLNEDSVEIYDYVEAELDRMLKEGYVTPEQAHQIGLLRANVLFERVIGEGQNPDSLKGE